MHAVLASVPSRRLCALAAAVAIALTALVISLAGPGKASAAACEVTDPLDCPFHVSGTFTYNVPLSAATQNATGVPGDPGATGTSNITLNADTNTVCATTSWSGVDSPVVAGHIHAGAYGQPENPAVTVNLFPSDFVNGKSSPASGCTTVPETEIGLIVRCKGQMNVVVHSKNHPVGALRGQLGTGGCAIPL